MTHLAAGLRAAAAAALLVPLLALIAPAAPAAAEHTEVPGSVTLVGSLQSELGCAGDWAPGCEETALARQQDGTWTATFTIPAGDWELKVALDGGWEESYGAGGGDANQPLRLSQPAELEVAYDHGSHRIGIAPASLPSGEVTAADRELVADSLREPLTRERFYFVMADRFANGDPGNDTGGLDGGRLDHGFDPEDKGFFHGGDIAGLTERLDYIEGLGTTAVWLTPSFQNRPVQGIGTSDVSAGYHGYWVTDFTRLDPHFGTNAELEDFVDAAHQRGIKVFFDIITNHTADVLDYAEGEAGGGYDYVDKATEPYRDASGDEFDDRDYAGTGEFPALDEQTSFPYTPTFPTEADRTVKVPEWLNDPTLYHNRGNSTFAGESGEYGDFFGLDDLFTEHPDVVEGMSEVYRTWVDFGIDGFRIDTVKHVNMEFWQEFAPAIRDHATARGNDDFLAFGEVFESSPELMSRYTTRGRMDATLDFGFQAAGTGFAKGGATTGLRDFFAADDWYTDTDSNVYAAPTFLGNHDMGRIGGFLDDAASGDELLDRDRLAHALMYLVRGQPVVYYGDEQGFTGPGGDKLARQDMFPTEVAEYADDDQIGTRATPADDNFDTGHPLYREISALAALRERFPALADGAQLHRYASDRAGVYAVSRIAHDEQREFVVALNNATTEKTVTVSTLMRQGGFRQVWPATGARARSDAERRLRVTVPPTSAVVWRANGTLAEREEAPALTLESPGAGGVVGGRAEIRAGVAEDGLHQVTFGWRPVGGTGWTRLGTDDNAPYRVFHDLEAASAELPDGTLLEYRAVLEDSSGNLSVASSYGIVGEPAGAEPEEPGDPGTGPVTQPDAVSMPGSHNSEIGCTDAGGGPADWDPACEQAQLSLDAEDLVWHRTVDVPAGSYEYKAAVNRSWDENYGMNAVRGGSNIPLVLTAPRPVKFYYDHGTHWITTSAQDPIVTAAGSFQSELGCTGDWRPDCLRSWLKDPDGDGTYTFATADIPAGSYAVKATHGEAWDVNYGEGGAPNGADIRFDVPTGDPVVVFSYDVATHQLVVSTRAAGPEADLTERRAHWLREDLLAWDVPDGGADRRHRLHWSTAGDLEVDAEAVTGGDSVPLALDPAGLPADVVEQFPHLAGLEAFRLDRKAVRRVPEILTGQLAVAAYRADGTLADATGVQVPGVLDDVYADAADADLGATWAGGRPTVTVWAPTAQDVGLLLWQGGAEEPRRVPMTRRDDGTWAVRGERSWRGASYQYDVRVWAPEAGQVVRNRVTDPYSHALTTNSRRSVLVDLADPALAPPGWSTLRAPRIARPEHRTVYELHVRDFSIGDDRVPAVERGTYRAFTRDGTGTRHLRRLAAAGLNTVHLLPAFDIATVEEVRSSQAEPDCDLASYPPASTEQQACVEEVRERDGFNWGYDPYHYTTPEGSYATDPEGPARTREFRQMVQGLNGAGLQVVMDVVYNHTAASGQAERSVLDRVVPGYYHRLSARGDLETSTCCANTATEHLMMEKLMVDSVVTWARDYKVNGFRFDLMGHHSKANMLAVRKALDGLTLREDGVDGSQVYLYGEGWNFGEVADDARFEQASQLNLAGTGIGSFSDRLRDAVRGGGPFDENPRVQGFGSGLYTDPNGDPVNGTGSEQVARLLHAQDLVKLGMAGNLADFTFRDSYGETVRGSEVDYNGQPAGYAADPSETVTYVDAHDNETLFDSLAFKLPRDTPMADRVRMNTVSLATVALGQGVVFWHAGTDLLRSKSLDRNSYDSGDWFNRVDWTGAENAFGSGLPRRADNESKWPYMRPLLEDPALQPDAAAMAAATTAAQELLRIRGSSTLFRLGSLEAIQSKVSFLDAEPGVVAMLVDDTAGPDADPERDGILVVVNAAPDARQVAGTGAGWSLHPVQAGGADPVVRRSTAGADEVLVPGRTVAVFER